MRQKLKILTYFSLAFLLVILSHSCEPRVTSGENPFDKDIVNQDTVGFVFEDIDPNSIAGLYQNIFNPTCANVGCHDGTFEPDFRTIESSYHSLVYQIPVKNDGSLTYRVDPGNPGQSAIIKRMLGTIEPIMPIEVEPDSDWDIKGDEYIENVRTWIQNGALDLAGNKAQADFINPSLFGAIAMYQGEVLNRQNGHGNIIIPNSVNQVEFYFAFDSINNPLDFSVNELAFGYEDGDTFEESTTVDLTILNTPLQQYGLNGTLVDFTHKVDLNLNTSMLTEDSYYMRLKVKDGNNPTTEIPANNGLYFIKEYMSFRRSN
jgi:hypothetical protein